MNTDFKQIIGSSNLYVDVGQTDGAYINASGEIVSDSTYAYTDLIDVEEKIYDCIWNRISTTNYIRIHGYDSSGTWLSQLNFSNSSEVGLHTLEFNCSGVSKIRLSFKPEAQRILGIYDSETILDCFNNQLDTLHALSQYFEPVNLYNKDSELNRENQRVTSSGNYESLSGSSVSHPIKCKIGQTFCFKWSSSWYGTSTNAVVRACTAEGVLLSDSIASVGQSGNSYGKFTVPGMWEYFCVNVRMIDKSSMIISRSSTLPEYSNYFEPYYKIREDVLPEYPDTSNLQVNSLYGKKLAFTGDSICYGAGFGGGYPAIIQSNNNATISNTAQSGGTLCSGTNRFCISKSVDTMPSGYDYYIVEGGVNDASQEHGETLGIISSGYNSTLDTTTVCGAMEYLCKKLQLNFPGKKYGFIFPHNVYGDTASWNTGWRDSMKQCLKKWGIPYLDLSDECAQLRNLDSLRVYTSNSDGWHPTEDGYKLYYVPKIEAWMKTL